MGFRIYPPSDVSEENGRTESHMSSEEAEVRVGRTFLSARIASAIA